MKETITIDLKYLRRMAQDLYEAYCVEGDDRFLDTALIIELIDIRTLTPEEEEEAPLEGRFLYYGEQERNSGKDLYYVILTEEEIKNKFGVKNDS